MLMHWLSRMTQQYLDYAGCIKNREEPSEVISFHYFCNYFLLIVIPLESSYSKLVFIEQTAFVG